MKQSLLSHVIRPHLAARYPPPTGPTTYKVATPNHISLLFAKQAPETSVSISSHMNFFFSPMLSQNLMNVDVTQNVESEVSAGINYIDDVRRPNAGYW
jgi:hypothetical protein